MGGWRSAGIFGLLLLWGIGGLAGGSGANANDADTVTLPASEPVKAADITPKGEEKPSAEASGQLRRLLGDMETLSAGFTQTVTDRDGYELQSMTGDMTVARPGYIHWETEPPYEQLLVGDTETLWLYDRDLEQVTVRPFMRDVVESPAMLLIGDVEDVDRKYEVSRSAASGGARFVLVPRDEAAVYRRLTLSFEAGIPNAMSLEDSLGQTTRIEFENVATNQPVSPELFHFEIPDGVDVLRDD